MSEIIIYVSVTVHQHVAIENLVYVITSVTYRVGNLGSSTMTEQ